MTGLRDTNSKFSVKALGNGEGPLAKDCSEQPGVRLTEGELAFPRRGTTGSIRGDGQDDPIRQGSEQSCLARAIDRRSVDENVIELEPQFAEPST